MQIILLTVQNDEKCPIRCEDATQFIFARYYYGDQVKQNELDRTGRGEMGLIYKFLIRKYGEIHALQDLRLVVTGK